VLLRELITASAMFPCPYQEFPVTFMVAIIHVGTLLLFYQRWWAKVKAWQADQLCLPDRVEAV